jgi:hypothetical protein
VFPADNIALSGVPVVTVLFIILLLALIIEPAATFLKYKALPVFVEAVGKVTVILEKLLLKAM